MTKKMFAEVKFRMLETNLVVHPVIQWAVELVGSPFLWRSRLADLNKGSIARPTTQHLPHPVKVPCRQCVPQLSPLARELMKPSKR